MDPYRFPDACVAIFAKAPEPGKVKTRLQPAISQLQSADLQARLILETLDLTHRRRLCPVQLWCSPSTRHPVFLEALERFPVRLITQAGNDLGDRMDRAIKASLETSASVVLIGCDCPSLTLEDLIAALNALDRGSDVVLGPAEDGGYVLIGMKQPLPGLFRSMPWGTAEVLAETRSRIRNLGLRCFETRLQWDLDRPEDFQRYLAIRRNPAKVPN